MQNRSALLIFLALLSFACGVKKTAVSSPVPPPSALSSILTCANHQTDACEDGLVTHILIDVGGGIKNYYEEGPNYRQSVKTWVHNQGMNETTIFSTELLSQKLQEVYRLEPDKAPWQLQARSRAVRQILAAFIGYSEVVQ